MNDPFSHDRRRRTSLRLTQHDRDSLERIRQRYQAPPSLPPRDIRWGIVLLLILGAVACAWAMFEMVVGGVGQ